MERKDVLSIIPKPKNEDVIIYDLSLKSLIDKDVFEEYKKDLNLYKLKREKYILLDNEIKEYQNILNNTYLYNNAWEEEDYITMLRNEKKTYSLMFAEAYKIENNIEILSKKYETINEKIAMQQQKEKKEIDNKKKNIDQEIENSKDNVLILKAKINDLKLNKQRNEEILKDVQDEIELCYSMQQDLNNDEFKCKYCGSIIKNERSKNKVANLLINNVNKAMKKVEKYSKELEKNEKDIAYYENEFKKNKTNLSNNIEFKKQDYNFYMKKSVKVLELEAARDDVLKEITKLKKEYETNKQFKNPKLLEIKERITKYELSLQNLQKIKDFKGSFSSKLEERDTLKAELMQLYNNLLLYKKFIEIFYKIYQKKANDYFGNEITFKLYRFNNFDLEEIFEVYFRGIEYTQLSRTQKEEFDNIYIEKMSFLY